MYREFKSFVTLQENKRIQYENDEDILYDDFLTQLRGVNRTTADYNKIHTKFSDHSLNRQEWEEKGFGSDDVT